MRTAAVFLVLVMGALGLLSCTSVPGGDGKNELEIKLAPIHELDVRFGESFPIQVFLYVKGGLPDGCTRFRGLEIKSRSGNHTAVEVTIERPKEAVCPAVYGFFEQNINLGTDFTTGKAYTVTVNERTTSFTMP